PPTPQVVQNGRSPSVSFGPACRVQRPAPANHPPAQLAGHRLTRLVVDIGRIEEVPCALPGDGSPGRRHRAGEAATTVVRVRPRADFGVPGANAARRMGAGNDLLAVEGNGPGLVSLSDEFLPLVLRPTDRTAHREFAAPRVARGDDRQ